MSSKGRLRFAVSALLFLVVTPQLFAQPPSCRDYHQSYRWIGEIAVTGTVWDVAVDQSLAIIATHPGGLVLADISRVNSPRVLASLPMPGTPRRLAVNGTVVYVAINYQGVSAGIAVVDISDPGNPRMMEYVHLGTYVHDLSLVGAHLFAACNSLGLLVCDVSQPSHLQVQGRLQMLALGVTAVEGRAYVVGRGLSIVDASDPWNPTLIGFIETPETWAIAIREHHAYLGTLRYGLQIVDVTDPAALFVSGHCEYPGTTLDVNLVGNCAYIAGCGLRPTVLNIEDPATPRVMGTLNADEASFGLFSTGCLLFLGTGEDGVQMFNIASPPNSSVVSQLQSRSWGTANGIAVLNGLAAVSDDITGYLDVIDVHDPSHPIPLSSCWLPKSGCGGYANGVVLNGNLAYVCNGQAGLKVIDLSSPSLPRIIGGVSTPGAAVHIELHGPLAVVADLYFGILLIDISTPSSPVVVGSQRLLGNSRSVAVDGSYAYVAADRAGLQIVDISDPRQPLLVSSIETPGIANHVLISRPYAYVTVSPGFLSVVDVTDPLNPKLVRTIKYPGLAGDQKIADGFLYVCDRLGIEVFDLSDPGRPRLVGGVETPGHSSAIEVTEECVFVADWGQGLTILPRHCPGLVSAEIKDLKAVTEAHTVRLTWTPGSDISELEVERSLHPTQGYVSINPKRIIPEFGEFVDARAEGYNKYFYRLKVVTDTGETKFFGPVSARIVNEFKPVLDPVSPNPVLNGSASISFTLHSDGNVRLRILDILGRQVRILGEGRFNSGAHVLNWDGRSDVGEMAPAGIYFCEFRGLQFATTQRFVRLR